MKTNLILEFSTDDHSRQELEKLSNDQLYQLFVDGKCKDSYTLKEFVTSLNDYDTISTSWFFLVEVESENENPYHSLLVDYIKNNCEVRVWQVAQAWECIDNKCPIPNSVSRYIEDCMLDFCNERELTDNNIELEDTEDLFRECFDLYHANK